MKKTYFYLEIIKYTPRQSLDQIRYKIWHCKPPVRLYKETYFVSKSMRHGKSRKFIWNIEKVEIGYVEMFLIIRKQRKIMK